MEEESSRPPSRGLETDGLLSQPQASYDHRHESPGQCSQGRRSRRSTTTTIISNISTLYYSSEEEVPEDTSRRIFGYVCIFLSGVLHGCAAGLYQYLGASVPNAEMNILRFGTLGVLLSPWMVRSHCDVKVSLPLMLWILVVGFLFCTIAYLEYACLDYIAIGTATAMLLSLVIILETLVSFAVYHWIRINMIIASVLAVVGILLIAQPAFVFDHVYPDREDSNASARDTCFTHCPETWNNATIDGGDERGDAATALSGEAIGYTMLFITSICLTIKDFAVHLKLAEVGLGTYGLWVSLMGTLLSLVVMGIAETPSWPQCLACSLAALGHMVTAAGGRAFWFLAVQRIRPLEASLFMGCLLLVGNTTLQYTVLADINPGYHNWEEYLGFVLILLVLVVGPGVQLIYDRKEKVKNDSL